MPACLSMSSRLSLASFSSRKGTRQDSPRARTMSTLLASTLSSAGLAEADPEAEAVEREEREGGGGGRAGAFPLGRGFAALPAAESPAASAAELPAAGGLLLVWSMVFLSVWRMRRRRWSTKRSFSLWAVRHASTSHALPPDLADPCPYPVPLAQYSFFDPPPAAVPAAAALPAAALPAAAKLAFVAAPNFWILPSAGAAPTGSLTAAPSPAATAWPPTGAAATAAELLLVGFTSRPEAPWTPKAGPPSSSLPLRLALAPSSAPSSARERPLLSLPCGLPCGSSRAIPATPPPSSTRPSLVALRVPGATATLGTISVRRPRHIRSCSKEVYAPLGKAFGSFRFESRSTRAWFARSVFTWCSTDPMVPTLFQCESWRHSIWAICPRMNPSKRGRTTFTCGGKKG
mmetsp:Transcript_15082/g.35493  ORF Transcript_15082/g.35493 Transcript_15082/m.35493 type:complete len:403 (+) Transcript_15082:372-1580(+)